MAKNPDEFDGGQSNSLVLVSQRLAHLSVHCQRQLDPSLVPLDLCVRIF